jgi:hypothetical protein
LVEVEEGIEAGVSPKVATAVVTRVGRGRQAMAVVIQIANGIKGREESKWGLGWVG